MSNQPQEWTPEYLSKLMGLGKGNYDARKLVADAHNAALAAIKKECDDTMDRHEQQLAAAVEDFKRYHHNPIISDLNKQLAAERKHSAFCSKMANERLNEIVVLNQQQLATEREKVK